MNCENVIKKIKPSIALVLVYQEGKIVGKASGFIFFKKGLLVTCNHVVLDRDLKIFLQFPNIDELISAKVVIRDEEHDIVLLKYENDILEPLIRCDETKIKEGMSVIFSGYPLSLSSLTTHQGLLSGIIVDA
ncbi:MAG: serine protease, partial [Candidatus Margulisiibacteriota bacterium]